MAVSAQPTKKQKRKQHSAADLFTAMPLDLVNPYLSFLGVSDLIQWSQVSTQTRELGRRYCRMHRLGIQRLFNQDRPMCYKVMAVMHTLLRAQQPQQLVDYMTRMHRTWGVIHLPLAWVNWTTDFVGTVIHSEYSAVLIALREQQWMDPYHAIDIEMLKWTPSCGQAVPLMRELSNPHWGLGPENWLTGHAGPSAEAHYVVNSIVGHRRAECLALFQPPSPWAVEWSVMSRLVSDRAIVKLAWGGDVEMFRVFLRWGTPFVMERLSHEVLVTCAKNGHQDILRLLREKVHLDGFPQLDPWTMRRVLYPAVRGNHLECVQELAQPYWGFNGNAIKTRPWIGESSLFALAANNENADMIRLLAEDPFRLSRAIYHSDEEDEALERKLTADPRVPPDVLKAFEEVRRVRLFDRD